MALQKVGKFVLTDSSLDRHSERILVEGVDLKSFKANPVMFYNHLKTAPSLFGNSEKNLPIGIWKNIKRKNGQITADAYIDMNDDFGAKVANKVELGIISSASVGIAVRAISDDVNDKVKGQLGVTITKSEMLESSIVDIPANPNAKLISKLFAEKSELGESIDFENTTIVKTASLLVEDNINQTENKNTMGLVEFIKNFFNKEVKDDVEGKKFLGEQKPLAEQIEDAVKSVKDEAKKAADAAQETIDGLNKSIEGLNAQIETVKGAFAEVKEKVENKETVEESDTKFELLAEKMEKLSRAFNEKFDKKEKEAEDAAKAAADKTKSYEDKIKALTEQINTMKGKKSGGQESNEDAAPVKSNEKVKSYQKTEADKWNVEESMKHINIGG